MLDVILSYPFILLFFVLSLLIQWRVTGIIGKHHKERNSLGKSGAQMADAILSSSHIKHVAIQEGKGNWVADFYDPLKKLINLSPEVFQKSSISALAIAAHECGHALQHHAGYFPIKIRNVFYPIAHLGSWLGPILLIAGLYLQFTQLFTLGIYFYAGAVAFTILNLPVEFDASRRALVWIQTQTSIGDAEVLKIKRLLNAAAMTYVMAAIISFLQLLRFIMLRRN